MKRTHIVNLITALILSLVLMFSAVSTVCFASENTVTITFNATVPYGIPQGTNVSIGSNLNS